MQPGGHVVGRCHTGAAVLVSQQFFGGEPVIKFAACGLAFFQPESMGGVLNFGLSWLDLRRRAGAGTLLHAHGTCGTHFTHVLHSCSEVYTRATTRVSHPRSILVGESKCSPNEATDSKGS